MIAGRRGPLACAAFLFLSWLAPVERPARAAGFTATLEYTAPPTCPDVRELKALVVSRVAYDPFTENAANHVLVRISPRGGGLEGSIEWRDSTGSWAGDQTFSRVNGDCPPLVRAMGLALAVQIQLLTATGSSPDGHAPTPAEARSAPPPPTPSPSPPEAVPAVPSPPPLPPPVPEVVVAAPARSAGVHPVFAMGAGPALGFGLSSAPVWLGRVFGAVAWPHVSLELAAEASLPATTRRADGAGISQQYLLVNAAACALVRRWEACLVANAGEVRMVGEIDRPTSAQLPLVEVGARAGVIQPLGTRAFVSAHADGLVRLTRWTASLDQFPVWTSPRLAAAVAVECGVRFP